MKRRIYAYFLLILLAAISQTHAVGDRLYGVQWWEYSNPNTGFGPDNGWSVETIVTNATVTPTLWQAPNFVPLYQSVTGPHNASIITRVDYDWNQTVPASSTLAAQAWATNVVNNVVTPL